jgi:hypothetical protein
VSQFYCMECGRIREIESPAHPELCSECGCLCAPVPRPMTISDALLRDSVVRFDLEAE